jgi:hypothetical protein
VAVLFIFYLKNFFLPPPPPFLLYFNVTVADTLSMDVKQRTHYLVGIELYENVWKKLPLLDIVAVE